MPESIFSIASIIFIIVIISYIVYILFSYLMIAIKLKRISAKKYDFDDEEETQDEKEYRLYLKNNKLKPISKHNFEAPEVQVERELEVCSEFIKQNPNNIYALEKRIFLNSNLKAYEDIIEDYKSLMKKNPDNFEYVSMCAKYYALLQDLRTALNLVNNFYVGKEYDDKYYDTIGDILRSLKDYKLALENYTKAIELNPENRFYYLKRSFVYKELNQMDKYEEDSKIFKNGKIDKIDDVANKNESLEIKQATKNRIVDVIKVSLVLFVFFAIIYFHPTNEVLSCDSQSVCKIERSYFNLFKITKKINLYPNSNLTCKIGAYSATKRNTNYGLYIKIDDVSPFVFYVADSLYSSRDYQIEELKKVCDFYYQTFIEYRENPIKYSYVLNSKASLDKMILGLIFAFSFFVILFYEKIEKFSKKNK